MIDVCTGEDIAWVPYFPLGSAFPGFPKVADNPVVLDIAGELGATASQVGLAWVLARAPNTLLIPGTRSIAHLEENLGAGHVTLERRGARPARRRHHPGGRPVGARSGPLPGGADRLTTVAGMAPMPMTQFPWWLKPGNKVFIRMSRLGLSFGGESPVVLTVPGRKSGTQRSTPVTPMTVDGRGYVVAGFPGADWVPNAGPPGKPRWPWPQRGAGADGRVVRRGCPAVAAGLPRSGAHGRRVHEAGRAGRGGSTRGIRGAGRPLRGIPTRPGIGVQQP